jgi:crossover junction endodeoxyribonuclease RuvC
MKALGIDPGYDRLGVAIIEHTDRERVVYSTCIETDKHTPLPERLVQVGDALAAILTTHQPDVVGVETLFFNKNVKTAIGVAQARGIIVYLCHKHNCSLYELGPQEIKIALTGYGKSDKAAVIDMVKRLVADVPDGALDDEYDAIAAAVTALAHHR